jgi:hypothetical protein
MNSRLALVAAVLSSPVSPATSVALEQVDFARDVKPILEKSCVKCHGASKQQGGLRFDRRDGALGTGDSGNRVVVPGKADESELLRRVNAADESKRMPHDAEPLHAGERQILQDWIAQGARWPDDVSIGPLQRADGNAASGVRREMIVTEDDRQHWSYRPLRAIDAPAVADAAWCRTPIDRFVRSTMETRGTWPNPPADRRTLIRRVHFDLIGLPPAPEDVEAFVADPSPRAYEALVDRLLDSRHYGERWARHWLDVARYADSGGMESDADRPNAYQYRDFVIRALNDDLSYETFVRWQLAGDEYEPDDPRALAATGFLTGAPGEMLTDQHLEEERLRLRYNELDDLAVTSASAFLGLTVGCARCHDHKFDAIPTRDYYRIQCAFTTTAPGNVFLAPRADVSRYREEEARFKERLQGAQAKLSGWLAEQEKPHTARLRDAKIDALPVSDGEKKLLREQPDGDAAQNLSKKHRDALAISDDDYRGSFGEEQRRTWDALKEEVEAVQRGKPTPPPRALAITDTKPTPQPTWLLERGDFYARKERLELGFLTVLTNGKSPAEYLDAARRDGPPNRSTLQRRAMADWITDVEHGAGALLARVIVNRIWQHHFGEGLVRTVSDFGTRGERPTHPELLEWLARDFVAGGWRIKSLHRLILTSAVYLQNAAFDAERAKIDPENRTLWRRPSQRLEAEILRDAVLSVSGALNLEPYGPAFKPPIPAEAIVARNTTDPYPQDARDTPATRRRTVYMFHKRVVQHPLMQAFDGPDASVSCGRRSCTTVAPQALALLNDTILRDRAMDFARRLTRQGSEEPADVVDRGFRLALSRAPSDAERAESVQFWKSQIRARAARAGTPAAEDVRLEALADFCQTLFSTNEFIYVD